MLFTICTSSISTATKVTEVVIVVTYGRCHLFFGTKSLFLCCRLVVRLDHIGPQETLFHLPTCPSLLVAPKGSMRNFVNDTCVNNAGI